jgi:hypothetical protein
MLIGTCPEMLLATAAAAAEAAVPRLCVELVNEADVVASIPSWLTV